MSESTQLRNYFRLGLGATVAGTAVSIAGALFAHFTELPLTNNVGAEIYPAIPRGWGWVLIGQTVSLTGVMMVLAGLTLAFLYKREMTWARAALGATLFSALMMIFFGVIPNQWLTLTQSTFAWTPQEIAFTVPEFLTLNNEVAISYAVVKDVVLQGFVGTALIGTPIFMYWWQGYTKRVEEAPPVEPVSRYGRPLTKVER